MKTSILLLTVFTGFLACDCALAQDSKKTDAPTSAGAEKQKPTTQELEAKFKAALTRATLSGRNCFIKNGVMGSDTEDKYTITGVKKAGGDVWIISARLQYGQKDIEAPIPVRVAWAGNTPVIIVDNVGVPGGGTYSARVMIYEKTYAGTWTGGDHGGLLSGVITNAPE